MGKPSSSRLSRKSDSHSSSSSFTRHKIQAPMKTRKMETIKRKKMNRTKSKIKTLFSKLKQQSENTLNSSEDVSVISLDSSELNETIVEVDVPTTSGKRKTASPNNSAKRRKTDDSLIIVNNDDVKEQNVPVPQTPKRHGTPIHCSTPLNERNNQPFQLNSTNIMSSLINNSSHNFNEEVDNLTKEINRDSYITIDLTAADSVPNVNNNNIVIDLDQHDDSSNTEDCTVISVSNASLSMSGDSDVTVLRNKINKKKQINKFAKGISKLNSSEKGKLLELIAKNIFSGCNIPGNLKRTLSEIQQASGSSPGADRSDTLQDSFIKEVILGEAKSRNSIGSNIYHPREDVQNKKGLRMIVIDGSNVAMEHTKGASFSVKGLKICIDYFVNRGHVVKAFVPRFRCKYGKSSDPKLLSNLERRGLVVFTPSREIQGRICVPYDDRYIVQCAAEFDGVIVSGDNYRDLIKENPRWRFVIENRVLPFTWVNDMIMFPRDPLGRNGPTLEEFLRHPRSTATVVGNK